MKTTTVFLTTVFLIANSAFGAPPKKGGRPAAIWAGEDGKGCIRGTVNVPHQALNAQIEALVAKARAIEVGNGATAVNAYDPKTFKINDGRAAIRKDMENMEAKGVTFETATGVAKVTELATRVMTNYLVDDAKAMIAVMNGLEALGVLQGVVFRGLSKVAESVIQYDHQPYQIFYYIRMPDGTGQRLEVFVEAGD